MKRAPVPSAEKQKESEKILKDLYKDQYAKKAPADRVALARTLLDQGRRSREDLNSLWAFYQEAQQIAAQNADTATALAAVEEFLPRLRHRPPRREERRADDPPQGGPDAGGNSRSWPRRWTASSRT